jgi:hypothetical protein
MGRIKEKDMDEVLEKMKFSYSSVNGFSTCPYGFYLTYIQRKPRKGNFFSDFGSFVHLIMEKYFGGDLRKDQLVEYYKCHYDLNVTNPPPPFPAGMGDTYFKDGLEFFETFEFPMDKYEVVSIEDSVITREKDYNLIVKPDLVLKNKETGQYVLVDYKTSKLKDNKKKDEEKIAEYKRQFLLYLYYIWIVRGIEITKIVVWFVRNKRAVVIPIDHNEVMETLEWFSNGIENIRKEEKWLPNNSKSNSYFCKYLCSVSEDCAYRDEAE